MNDRDERPTGAISRPGVYAERRNDGSSRRPEAAPPVDVAGVRMRLLESGLFEVLDALHASADEAFDGLLRAIDRLTGSPHDATLRPCEQCSRLTTNRFTQGRPVCSQACRAHLENEVSKPPPRRRKASGALI